MHVDVFLGEASVFIERKAKTQDEDDEYLHIMPHNYERGLLDFFLQSQPHIKSGAFNLPLSILILPSVHLSFVHAIFPLFFFFFSLLLSLSLSLKYTHSSTNPQIRCVFE